MSARVSATCRSRLASLALIGLAAHCLGCGGATSPTPPAKPVASVDKDDSAKPAGRDDAQSSDAATTDTPTSDAAPGGKRKFAPVRLGDSTGSAGASGSGSGGKAVGTVLEAMQPLQVVLGQWRGVTRKKFGGTAKVEDPKWVWDFQTDRERPALTFAADSNHYFKSGRMTFLLDKQKFQFKAVDRDDIERVYEGEFTTPVEDVPGDDRKLQRTFKLTLTQVTPADERKLAQLVFAQQENNRYLMEIYDKRTDGVLLVDTVANQREGTSFAINPDDYGERACVVSGGLGTTAVSHNGKTYYVCCSGCAAAFKDEPERWIAKFEASKKKPE